MMASYERERRVSSLNGETLIIYRNGSNVEVSAGVQGVIIVVDVFGDGRRIVPLKDTGKSVKHQGTMRLLTLARAQHAAMAVGGELSEEQERALLEAN